MCKVYGYARVSTEQQNIDRQIKNIKAAYPDAVIVHDEYTGTKMDRPAWSQLYRRLLTTDQQTTVVFDSVSRMSRNAEEGYRVYQQLYRKGIELVFLKEPQINTATYKTAITGRIKTAIETGDAATDNLINGITDVVNTYIMALSEKQIALAFQQAEKEVMDTRQRVKEGMAVAKENNERLQLQYPDTYRDMPDYKKIGREDGDKLTVKKQKPIEELIRKYSRDFDGHNNDAEVMAILDTKTVPVIIKKRSGKEEIKEIPAHLSRNTFYKYKKRLVAERNAV